MESTAPTSDASSLAASIDCFTEDELGTLAGVSPFTLENWRKAGDGPAFVRLGKRILYPRATVREFIAKHVRTGPAKTAAAQL